MCTREPSKHYTYQAVNQMCIYGGLHKQFRQQLTSRLLLFLGTLEKHPADFHPLSLQPSNYILGRPRTLVSKQPSYVSLPYELCVVYYSWQTKKASLTITVASSWKTVPFKYGGKIYIGGIDTIICPVETIPSYTRRSINYPDLHPNAMPLAEQLLSMLPQASTSCAYFTGYKCICDRLCEKGSYSWSQSHIFGIP